MSSASTRGTQVLDHFELVRHLGAAEDGDERPVRLLQHPAEILDLLRHQQAGGRLLRVMDDALGRRVRAVRRAEGVVDVDVGERRELPREAAVVLLLFGVEAQVLEQHHAAGLGLLDRPCARRPRSSPRRTRPAGRAAPTAARPPAAARTPGSASLRPPRCDARITVAPCSSA